MSLIDVFLLLPRTAICFTKGHLISSSGAIAHTSYSKVPENSGDTL